MGCKHRSLLYRRPCTVSRHPSTASRHLSTRWISRSRSLAGVPVPCELFLSFANFCFSFANYCFSFYKLLFLFLQTIVSLFANLTMDNSLMKSISERNSVARLSNRALTSPHHILAPLVTPSDQLIHGFPTTSSSIATIPGMSTTIFEIFFIHLTMFQKRSSR